MKLIAGNSNRPLAEAISAYLGVALTQAAIRRFSDMEIFVEILENMRGEDVFVIQSTSYPANDNLMELLVADGCAKARLGASAPRRSSPTTATPARTASPAPARRFRPSWWPT